MKNEVKSVTPNENMPDLAEALGLKGMHLKREDLHPYGSHKGRSIPPMIDRYVSTGDRRFAISSSGNAGLAAALHVNALNSGKTAASGQNGGLLAEKIDLDIFVGNHVSPLKLSKLKEIAEASDGHIRVLSKERPIQALTLAIEEGARSLRQSTDDVALEGYADLAREIAMIKDAGAVFIGTSSGTTAQALASYFLNIGAPIQVHIIQTSTCHPMADAFDTFESPDERSLADAIVDIRAHRKEVLVPLIKKTGGRGWCASNNDIETAMGLVKKHCNLDISPNSALSIVGAMQAAYTGYEIQGSAVCLICGD